MKRTMNQRGMTLVELLAAIGIAGLIASGIAAAIHSFIIGTSQGQDQLIASHEIQNVSHWITVDAQMAETTDLVDGAPPVDHMTLSWVDRSGGGQVSHTSSYSLSGAELRRDYDGVVMTVARHISLVEFSITGSLITVTIRSSPGSGTSEEGTYHIYLRPTS